jgi:hypothetical protein
MARNSIQAFHIAARETVEATRQALIDTAKREHSRIMTTDPKPTRFVRTVDGIAGAREEAVKVNGRIVYRYPRLEEIVRAAMDLLFELSPVLSGEYRRAHTIFVGGAAASDLSAWDGTGEVVITNPLPYSRKIEAGKMKMRVLGTDHIYEQAEFLLRQRFGNQARIKFTYRGIVGGGMVDAMALPISARRRGKNGRFEKSGGHAHNRPNNRFPALEIEAIR